MSCTLCNGKGWVNKNGKKVRCPGTKKNIRSVNKNLQQKQQKQTSTTTVTKAHKQYDKLTRLTSNTTAAQAYTILTALAQTNRNPHDYNNKKKQLLQQLSTSEHKKYVQTYEKEQLSNYIAGDNLSKTPTYTDIELNMLALTNPTDNKLLVAIARHKNTEMITLKNIIHLNTSLPVRIAVAENKKTSQRTLSHLSTSCTVDEPQLVQTLLKNPNLPRAVIPVLYEKKLSTEKRKTVQANITPTVK